MWQISHAPNIKVITFQIAQPRLSNSEHDCLLQYSKWDLFYYCLSKTTTALLSGCHLIKTQNVFCCFTIETMVQIIKDQKKKYGPSKMKCKYND